MRTFWLVLVAVAALSGGLAAEGQGGTKQAAIPLPPMGWSSWNSFSNTINSDIVIAQAKAYKP